MSEPLVQVNNLKKYFPIERGLFSSSGKIIKAVDDITFNIRKGDTFGLVGESGSGKTTTGKLILNLIPPTNGEVWFEGKNIFDLSGGQMRKLRQKMQLIFQNPYISLNPRMKVVDIITEPLKIQHRANPLRKTEIASKMLETVALKPPEQFLNRYPHELSGGQRQRTMIARVLSLTPSLVVADEPVSGLDASVRSQILNLMNDVKANFDLSYLLITHDLSIVEYMSNVLAVMYLGRIVELGKTEDVLKDQLHPYTQMLVSAVPIPDPSKVREHQRFGEQPSPVDLPKGCRFNTRCPFAMARCMSEEPPLVEVRNNHYAACFLLEN